MHKLSKIEAAACVFLLLESLGALTQVAEPSLAFTNDFDRAFFALTVATTRQSLSNETKLAFVVLSDRA
jgi:hypothetical protein